MKVLYSHQPGTRFHTDQTCTSIQGTKHTYTPVDITEVGAADPCRRCQPDYPDIKVLHKRCRRCNRGKTYPCSHNGGVRVRVLTRRGVWTRYVWPEQAHRYELAEPAIRV